MRLTCRVVVVCGLLYAPTAFAFGPAVPAQSAGAAGTPPAAATPVPAPAPAPPPPATPTPAPTPPPPAAPPAATPPKPAPPPAPAPAPAAPAALTPTTTGAAGGGTDNGKVNLGLSPTMPTVGSGSLITAKQAESLTASTGGSSDEWKADFHGYLRAPLRISFGPPSPTLLPTGTRTDTSPPGLPPGNNTMSMAPCATTSCYPPGAAPPYPGTQWHSPTRVPGYLYTTWEYTNTVSGPWSQLNFTYGNSRAMATVIVDAYNQTDGSYRNVQAQQGIDQAFLTLNFPDALGDLGTLTWNVGTFQNRYGTAGKYDGGMYETYLFGRTHIAGETLTANFTNVDAAGNWAFSFEDGFGAKIDLTPFLNTQYYQVFTNSPPLSDKGPPYLSSRDVEYLPYAGPVPQGSTFVHHAHLGAKYQKLWTLGAHYLYTWTPDDNWDPVNSTLVNGSDKVPRSRGPIQGSMAITGVEARLSGGVYGDGYLGYSHIDARNINALADSIEVLHSVGPGYQFKQNFFGKTYNRHTGVYDGPENETGTVDNVLFQYSFSFGQLSRYPEDFWGDGPDLVLTAFGLLSIVDSKAPPIAGPGYANSWDMSTKKLKWGFDAIYTMLYWLGFEGRWDYVQPDLDAAYSRTPGNPGGSDLNFGVLTLRALIHTQFVTHETVQLQYAHYFLGKAAYPSYPYDWVAQADANMVGLFASMWW